MDIKEIVKSLERSTAAYRDIQPYSPHTCNTLIDGVSAAVQCFLRRDNDTLWIVFRGTDSLMGWVSNLTFCQKTIPYGNSESSIRVHTGFLNSYKTPDVRDKILESITDNTNYVKITGHSRGAALAILCAVDIQYNFPNRDIEVVLFGSPRVGNKAFVQSYNKRVDKTVRVENSNDIVTKLPLALMDYRHVGAKLHVGGLRLPLCFSPDDHRPHKYYSALITAMLGS